MYFISVIYYAHNENINVYNRFICYRIYADSYVQLDLTSSDTSSKISSVTNSFRQHEQLLVHNEHL